MRQREIVLSTVPARRVMVAMPVIVMIMLRYMVPMHIVPVMTMHVQMMTAAQAQRGDD